MSCCNMLGSKNVWVGIFAEIIMSGSIRAMLENGEVVVVKISRYLTQTLRAERFTSADAESEPDKTRHEINRKESL